MSLTINYLNFKMNNSVHFHYTLISLVSVTKLNGADKGTKLITKKTIFRQNLYAVKLVHFLLRLHFSKQLTLFLTTGLDSPAVMAMHELKLPKRQQANAVSIKNSISEMRSVILVFDSVSDATIK